MCEWRTLRNSSHASQRQDHNQRLTRGTLILHFFSVKDILFVFNSQSLEIRVAKPEDQISDFNSGLLNKEETASQDLATENSKNQKYLSKKKPYKPEKLQFTERIEILVNATQKCNLNCSYCFVNKGKFSYDDNRLQSLSPKTAKHLIEVLPNRLPMAKHICIHFYGGEPLLNLPAINEAVETALPMGDLFSFAITTNGTIATKKAIAILKKGKFNIVLSIDGPEHIHDTYRRTKQGSATHARVLEFLDIVRSENLFVRGSSVVRKGWSLQEAHDYLKSLPVNAIKAQAVRLPPSNPIALTGKERSDYFDHLLQIGKETIESILQDRYPKDDRFNNRVLQLLCCSKRESFCGAGTRTFGMSSDGTMLPCVLLAGKKGASLGNINDDGKWVKQGLLWATKHKPRKKCQECWALPLCGGGCPAMLSVCGEDECELVRANCEIALGIYACFLSNPQELLVLSGET